MQSTISFFISYFLGSVIICLILFLFCKPKWQKEAKENERAKIFNESMGQPQYLTNYGGKLIAYHVHPLVDRSTFPRKKEDLIKIFGAKGCDIQVIEPDFGKKSEAGEVLISRTGVIIDRLDFGMAFKDFGMFVEVLPRGFANVAVKESPLLISERLNTAIEELRSAGGDQTIAVHLENLEAILTDGTISGSEADRLPGILEKLSESLEGDKDVKQSLSMAMTTIEQNLQNIQGDKSAFDSLTSLSKTIIAKIEEMKKKNADEISSLNRKYSQLENHVKRI